jgi:hypothetical protein
MSRLNKFKKILEYTKEIFPKSLNLFYFYFILVDHPQSYNEGLPSD